MAKRSNSTQQTPIFELWGQRGQHNFDTVGESHHIKEITALLPKDWDRSGTELVAPVTLVHNPENRHDRNAVEVRASTGLLAHLSRNDAVRYAPVFARLQQAGCIGATTARIWASHREDWDGRRRHVASVRLDLAAPYLLIPANNPPAGGHRLLPVGEWRGRLPRCSRAIAES